MAKNGKKSGKKASDSKASHGKGKGTPAPKQMVYSFGRRTDGDGTQKSLLGGKGANLAAMARMGLPVPQASPSPPRSATGTTTTVAASRRSSPSR